MSLLSPLVPAFPNNLTNGTPADASQVMADFNNLRNAINNSLNATGATGGDQYVGLTTNSRYQGTSVFDALTQLMDRFQEADTGSVNALVITPTPAVSAYGSGMFALVKPANTTTNTTPTLQWGSAAALTIVNADGSAHVAGAIQANRPALFWVDTVNSKAVHLNPLRVTGSFTGTPTGLTTAPTGTINYAITSDASACYLTIPGNTFIGTSNASTFTITGGPTSIAPASFQGIFVIVRDNSVDGNDGILSLAAASSTITFGKSTTYGTGGFTTAGLKGFAPASGISVTVSYPLKP